MGNAASTSAGKRANSSKMKGSKAKSSSSSLGHPTDLEDLLEAREAVERLAGRIVEAAHELGEWREIAFLVERAVGGRLSSAEKSETVRFLLPLAEIVMREDEDGGGDKCDSAEELLRWSMTVARECAHGWLPMAVKGLRREAVFEDKEVQRCEDDIEKILAKFESGANLTPRQFSDGCAAIFEHITENVSVRRYFGDGKQDFFDAHCNAVRGVMLGLIPPRHFVEMLSLSVPGFSAGNRPRLERYLTAALPHAVEAFRIDETVAIAAVARAMRDGNKEGLLKIVVSDDDEEEEGMEIEPEKEKPAAAAVEEKEDEGDRSVSPSSTVSSLSSNGQTLVAAMADGGGDGASKLPGLREKLDSTSTNASDGADDKKAAHNASQTWLEKESEEVEKEMEELGLEDSE